MKLSYYCDSCKQENFIKTKASNRGDMQMQTGKDEVKERCKYCGHITTKHINRLIAVPNYSIVLIGICIGIFIAVFMFFRYGWLGTTALSIPIFVYAQQQKAASDFNSVMIRRRK